MKSCTGGGRARIINIPSVQQHENNISMTTAKLSHISSESSLQQAKIAKERCMLDYGISHYIYISRILGRLRLIKIISILQIKSHKNIEFHKYVNYVILLSKILSSEKQTYNEQTVYFMGTIRKVIIKIASYNVKKHSQFKKLALSRQTLSRSLFNRSSLQMVCIL